MLELWIDNVLYLTLSLNRAWWETTPIDSEEFIQTFTDYGVCYTYVHKGEIAKTGKGVIILF